MAETGRKSFRRVSTTRSKLRNRDVSLLVVGQHVNVRLVQWDPERRTFELWCTRKDAERQLQWTLHKTPKELIRFSNHVKKIVENVSPIRVGWCGGIPTSEQVEIFLDSVFSQFAGGWLMAAEIKTDDLNEALIRVESNIADDDLDPQFKETMNIFRIDAALSEFLQLSIASLKKELHYDGKFPEGYLHKAPIYYHDEMWFMNIIVIFQFIFAAGAIVTSVFLWAIWPLAIGGAVILILMLLHTYLARPSEPGRTIIIPCCFFPGLGQLSILLWFFYDYVLRKNQKRWCIFRPGYIAYFESNYDYEPRGVFIIDRKNTHIRSPWWHFCNPYVLQIKNNDQTLSLHASTTEEMRKWRQIIEETCSLTAPNSFSLPTAYIRPRDMFGQRVNVPAQWYVDAKFFYRDVYDAIKNAQHEVFITGWMLSAELLLVRDDVSQDTSLETILGEAVERGVHVHVLVYRDLELALPNNSRHAKERLITKGVQIIRHAAMSRAVGSTNHIFCLGVGDVWWSHHEKLVVVDQSLAFVGGVDLAFGRYDDFHHHLSDPDEKTWPGKDFYNVRIKEFEHLEDPHSDLIDRAHQGRMPWHDVHCSVGGNAAKDVAKHFIARWNRELRQGMSFQQTRKTGYRFLLPATYEATVLDNFNPLPYEAVACKVLRSIGPWSLSMAMENSIKNKYLELIAEAERFIYIENQFFNAPDIADALADRLWQALEDEVEFRVIVVLPQWPAFEGMPFDNPQTKIVLKFQHKTIDSIIKRLRAHPRIKTPEDIRSLIGFYSLRKAEMLAGQPISEQVYVHSKIMIVDDEKVIIGSANLNQRSLQGDRDSEVCLYFHAPDLARDLRCSLYMEHLGLHPDHCKGCRECSLDRRLPETTFHRDAYQLVKDPKTLLWQQTANENTAILEHLFPGMQPRDEYTTIKKAKAGFASLAAQPQDDIENQKGPEELISELTGHLVNTPLRFLREEKNLLPSITELQTYILPHATFD